MKNKLHSLIESIKYEVDNGYSHLSDTEKYEIFESILYNSIVKGLSELDVSAINSSNDPKARQFVYKHTGLNLDPRAAATKTLQRTSRIINKTGGDPAKINKEREKFRNRIAGIVTKYIQKLNLDPKEVVEKILANYGYDM